MTDELSETPPSPEEAHHFLKDDNDRRVEEIKIATNGKVLLEQAFDSVRATTYLKHLCLDMGILDRADLDFEGQRSALLDKIEGEIAEHEAALEKARAQAILMGGGPPGHLAGAAGPRIFKPSPG